MSADLSADLVRQKANYNHRLTEARAAGTSPGAWMAWELVHEAAGIVARTESRLAQEAWAA